MFSGTKQQYLNPCALTLDINIDVHHSSLKAMLEGDELDTAACGLLNRSLLRLAITSSATTLLGASFVSSLHLLLVRGNRLVGGDVWNIW